MKLVSGIAVLLLAACGGGGDDDDDVGPSADAAAGIDGAAGQADAPSGDFFECTFPIELGPENLVFLCNSDSSTECEVTNPPPFTVDVCSDQSAPDFTFRRNTGDNNVDTLVGLFMTTSVGTITAQSRQIIGIPDDTSVVTTVDIAGTTYDLTFQFNNAAETITISEFAPQ